MVNLSQICLKCYDKENKYQVDCIWIAKTYLYVQFPGDMNTSGSKNTNNFCCFAHKYGENYQSVRTYVQYYVINTFAMVQKCELIHNHLQMFGFL